jgi:L-lactate dehydrogenase complex protein LldF
VTSVLPDFRELARAKLADERASGAIQSGMIRKQDARARAWAARPELEELRERAHEVRSRTLADLRGHLARFTAEVEALGGHVVFCDTAAEASAYVLEVCRKAHASLAVKSKSMLTEEIELNAALQAGGVEVVETDLGEYIMQLAGEPPSHLTAPALEKTAGDVAALFSEAEGKAVSSDLDELVEVGRRRLRNAFLDGDVGITGVNFAVAETGTLCTVTNEGNDRLVTTFPRVHVAMMGMERVVPTLRDLEPLLLVLAASSTGQPLTAHTTLLTGPRRVGETDGPEELHVVIVDNGRSRLLDGKYREMLACIRCGACLNVCPVYRKAGGHAYGSVYSGPMGAVLTPLLAGLERGAALPHASSLCGSCTDVCPVKIPLHELLLDLRSDLAESGIASRAERLGFLIWSLAWSRPWAFRLTARVAAVVQRLTAPLPVARNWRGDRELPRLARRPFRSAR